jgi:hypothetical protein
MVAFPGVPSQLGNATREVRHVEGQDAGRLKTAPAAFWESKHRFAERSTEPDELGSAHDESLR